MERGNGNRTLFSIERSELTWCFRGASELPNAFTLSTAHNFARLPTTRMAKAAQMIKTRANDLARLAQLEFALAPGGEELDHDFAAILFQNLAATRLGLTAGLNEITVFSGRVVKIFHQGQQVRRAPGRKVLAAALQPPRVLGVGLVWSDMDSGVSGGCVSKAAMIPAQWSG